MTLKGNSWELHGYLKEVQRVFQGTFKQIQRHFKKVSREFKQSVKRFQENVKQIFKGV